MKWITLVWLLAAGTPVSAEAPDPLTRPAGLTASELTEYPTLPDGRRRLIDGALAVVNQSPWLPYLAGGADPAAGGFDCSGAMYFVLRKAGLEPPRSSPGQMDWLKQAGRLHLVPATAGDPKHVSLAALKPGDLLFWAKEDSPGVVRVHHVAMYLGTEKKDGHPVMINSTDGRTYRGREGNGYGVFDFRVPKAESHSKLVGYGTPPGVDES